MRTAGGIACSQRVAGVVLRSLTSLLPALELELEPVPEPVLAPEPALAPEPELEPAPSSPDPADYT